MPDETALTPVSPLNILDRMVAAGADSASIKAISDLCMVWKNDARKEQFAVAMNACQAEMRSVVRDMLNKETNKRYAPVETVQADTKPVYTKHGFSLKFTSEAGTEPGLTTVHLDVTHVCGHTERTSIPNLALDNKGPKGNQNKTEVQGMMSTLSFAQGRLIRLAFNIVVADEDKDGQGDAVGPKLIEELNALLRSAEVIFEQHGTSEAEWKRYKSWLFRWIGLETHDFREMPQKKFQQVADELKRAIRDKENKK